MAIVPITRDGDGMYDVYSRLLKDRIIFINGPFTDELANTVVAQLLLLESESREKDIAMYINSPGGSISACLAIYDTMQYITSDIQTVAFGTAASAASLILTAGTKGKRVALPNTRILLHQGFAGTEGKITDLEITIKALSELQETVFSIYSKHTGKSKKVIEKDLSKDFWMSPKEAVKYGLIDKVLEHREV